jgi:hypothetical protein
LTAAGAGVGNVDVMVTVSSVPTSTVFEASGNVMTTVLPYGSTRSTVWPALLAGTVVV